MCFQFEACAAAPYDTCNIDRIPLSEFSKEHFEKKYYGQAPVLLTAGLRNLGSDWSTRFNHNTIVGSDWS